jgi:cell division protein FtsL
MMRLNLVLLLAVLTSALYLVNVQYESRRLFAELDRARAEARRLEVESERLQVEKRAQATPLRVEKLAKEQLQMRTASPAITLYLTHEGRGVAMAGRAVNAPASAQTSGASTGTP